MESGIVLNSSKILSLLLSLVLLVIAGCGGSGGGSNSVEDFSPTPQPPDFKSISGSIQGLTGVLTLGWSDRSQIISTANFDIPLAFESDTSLELQITSQPVSQTCTIDTPTEFSNQATDIFGVEISCITQNTIRVNVENFVTGDPLPNINISATWNVQGTQETLVGVSDSDGVLDFVVPTFDGRIMINADPDSYGEQSKVVQNTLVPAGRLARMLMQPNVVGTSFDAVAGTDISVGNDVLFSIPGNALVDANGAVYNGGVSTEVTFVDPSLDFEIMPGDYLSIDSGGVTAPIESYGALSVTFTGNAGEVLDLATGLLVSINIPIANAAIATAPATSPLYHYDPATGYWTQEGSASRSTLASGLEVYTGFVNHFTTWNADEAYAPVMVNGCVENSSGAPFANVRVDAAGATYLGTSRAISDSNGLFSIPVKPNSNVLITAGDGLQSNTLQVSTGAADSTESVCLVASAGSSTINLTWGENPSDLDTRLYGFSAADATEDFQVNYTNRSATVNNITIDLDVDDTSSFGPEVTTLPDFPFAGVYRYAVHRFSGTGSIQSSPARVELNLRGQVEVFLPPSGQPTDCWAVLDLIVDAGGNATITPINSWEDVNYCTNSGFVNPAR